jgi:hypothetical protein
VLLRSVVEEERMGVGVNRCGWGCGNKNNSMRHFCKGVRFNI